MSFVWIRSLEDAGRLVRERRITHAWSQIELARRAKVARSAVQKLEGGWGTVNLETVLKLFSTLEIPLRAEPEERSDRHRLAELRSLAMHRRIAGMIRSDPSVADSALARVRGWLDGSVYFPASKEYAEAWLALLEGPRPILLDLLASDSELARALRQSSPFAGALSEPERQRVIAEVSL